MSRDVTVAIRGLLKTVDATNIVEAHEGNTLFIQGETSSGTVVAEAGLSAVGSTNALRVKVTAGDEAVPLSAFGVREHHLCLWEAGCGDGRRSASLARSGQLAALEPEEVEDFAVWVATFLQASHSAARASLFGLSSGAGRRAGATSGVLRFIRKRPWVLPLLYAEVVAATVILGAFAGAQRALVVGALLLPALTVGWAFLLRRLQTWSEGYDDDSPRQRHRSRAGELLGDALAPTDSCRRLSGRDARSFTVQDRLEATSAAAGVTLETQSIVMKRASSLLPPRWTAVRVRGKGLEAAPASVGCDEGAEATACYWLVEDETMRKRALDGLHNLLSWQALAHEGPYR